ncbi:MAG: hypothetical protein FJ010_07350 [Chloroflexi bacterium]|nr:hypothetical protein [Chloroflexota bacterium]
MKIKTFFFLIVLLAAACTRSPAASEAYTVNPSPADFVAGVDNPYFPLLPGAQWVYEAKLENGTIERIEIEILAETRQVNGVTATILHDAVYVDGELMEDTYDWFAQDKEGNVWYLGEAVDNYENGVLVSHEGAWEWGVDGALPGVIMWADPAAHLNEAYYQEYYAGQAEDMGQVLSVGESVTVPYGAFDRVVKTFDFSSLDSDLKENKFYAEGVGVIKEIDQITGEEVVLIEFTSPGD